MNKPTELDRQIQELQQRIAALEESRLARAKRWIRVNRRLATVAATIALLIPVAIYAAAGVIPYSFTAGNAAVASEVNANFTYLNNVAVPIGGIIGWHQDLAGVPALPGTGEWVKCDGQTLADANSPMNGQVIPNLNGNGLGANSPGQTAKVQMFLRGGTSSGTGQQDAFQGHYHQIGSGGGPVGAGSAGRFAESPDAGWSDGSLAFIRNPKTDGTNGTPRTANETRPMNMSVVWIMRVK